MHHLCDDTAASSYSRSEEDRPAICLYPRIEISNSDRYACRGWVPVHWCHGNGSFRIPKTWGFQDDPQLVQRRELGLSPPVDWEPLWLWLFLPCSSPFGECIIRYGVVKIVLVIGL